MMGTSVLFPPSGAYSGTMAVHWSMYVIAAMPLIIFEIFRHDVYLMAMRRSPVALYYSLKAA
jgi:hypothetical protein